MILELSYPSEMPLCRSRGSGRLLVCESWPFRINGIDAEIRPGFLCDLYSVPWPISMFIPRDERDNRPALIHDWLFATCGLRRYALSDPLVSLEECNQALALAMRRSEISRVFQWSINRGVRIGSKPIWDDYLKRGYSVEVPRMI